MENEKNTAIETTETTERAEDLASLTEEQAEEKTEKVSSKRIKKAQRREAKAARKAANNIEEKKSRPNNALIALLIFGVLVGMFAFVLGYNYFSKPATIEKYIEKNGGKEVYGQLQLDMYSTASITAKGNSVKIDMTVNGDDKETAKAAKEYYKGDDAEEQLKQISAYILTNMKPETRAFSADVKTTVKSGDDELRSVKMTYKEAKDYIEDLEKKAKEEAEQAEGDSGAESGTEEESGSDAGEEEAAE